MENNKKTKKKPNKENLEKLKIYLDRIKLNNNNNNGKQQSTNNHENK